MNKRNFLIKSSLKKKIKSKWFLILNIIIFVLIMLVFNTDKIINLFGGNYKEEKTIYLYDNAYVYDDFKNNFTKLNKNKEYKYKIINEYGNIDELKKSIKDDNKIILVVDSKNDVLNANLYTYSGLSEYTRDLISKSLNDINKKRMLQLYGIGSNEFEIINKSVDIKSNVINKKSNGDIKMYLEIFILLLIIMPGYFLITNLVQMIGSEINEEKSTKSMEIIIANVKPKDHLIAKVTSCLIFTIFQGVLLIIYTLLAIYIRYGSINASTFNSYSNITYNSVSSSMIINESLNAAVSSNLLSTLKIILPIIIIFFIFTLNSYAIMSGALASMSTNIDNFQQLQIPITILMALGLYLAFNAVLYDGSTFIKVMSFVPMLSFLIAPSLFMLEQISIFELLISLIIQIIFTFILYYYGLRVYKAGILNYQTGHLFKRILKALENKD